MLQSPSPLHLPPADHTGYVEVCFKEHWAPPPREGTCSRATFFIKTYFCLFFKVPSSTMAMLRLLWLVCMHAAAGLRYTKSAALSTPTGYTFACIQPGCRCPTGFALQGTTCVQTTNPTFACIQPRCTCPYGFKLNARTRMCVQQVIR